MNDEERAYYHRMTLENLDRCIHGYRPFYYCPEGCTKADYQVLPPRCEDDGDDSFLRGEEGIILERTSSQ